MSQSPSSDSSAPDDRLCRSGRRGNGGLLEILSGGVAYHHAGLSRHARACVKAAFRNRHIKIISCTLTLAAVINLPARLVVVMDIYQSKDEAAVPVEENPRELVRFQEDMCRWVHGIRRVLFSLLGGTAGGTCDYTGLC